MSLVTRNDTSMHPVYLGPGRQRKLPLFACVYLTFLFGAFYILFTTSSGDELKKAGESTLYRLTWVSLYLALAFYAAKTPKFATTLVSRGWPLLLLIASTLLTYALEPPSDITAFVRFCMYVLTALFGLWLAVSTSTEQLFHSIYKISIFVVVAHWLLLPVIPAVVQWDALERANLFGTGSYGGIFGHKNLAGSFFGFAALVALCRANSMRFGKRKLAALAVMGLHLASLAATGAVGPLLSAGVAIFVLYGLKLTTRRPIIGAIFWIALAAAFASVIVFINPLLMAFGRDVGFTGRDILVFSMWPRYFWDSPALGYGFAAFQYSAHAMAIGDPNNEFYGFSSFEASYLELLIQVGIIGTAIYAVIYGRALLFAFHQTREDASVYKLAPFVGFVFITVGSLTDTYLVLQNHFYTALVFWAFFSFRHHRIRLSTQP